MEKRKVYKISIIDKEISRTEFDRNTFYTSDSELTLVFKLIEREYSYDHGEILLYNENDKSFVTRKIKKQENDFVYEIDSDIIPHYGTWKAQLQLVNDGDIYTSKPFDFSIVNDLSNLAPQPTLTDINNWSTLKKNAAELIDEMLTVIDDIKKAESKHENAEMIRQNQENSRVQSESERQSQERLRSQCESQRKNQENKRVESENERNKNESNRQQAEGQRQSTFELNETERQTTFETAEQERQSAELIRVENEEQRNLTSVDEFIKLQDAIGGRNYILNSNFAKGLSRWVANGADKVTVDKDNYMVKVSSGAGSAGIYQGLSSTTIGETYTISAYVRGTGQVRIGFDVSYVVKDIQSSDEFKRISFTTARRNSPYVIIYTNRMSDSFDVKQVQVEKGSILTDWKLAPQDYTIVSKDDYYNHIKTMSDHRDKQIAELKTAITALGGA